MINSPWRSALLMLALLVVVAVMAVYRLPPDAPEWLGILRPSWIAIWALYWVVAWEGRIGIYLMLPVGLVADVLVGTPFGLHVVLVSIAGWVGLRFGEVFRSGSMGLGTIIVTLMFVASAIIRSLAFWLAGDPHSWLAELAGSLVSVVLMMIFAVTLRRVGPAPARSLSR